MGRSVRAVAAAVATAALVPLAAAGCGSGADMASRPRPRLGRGRAVRGRGPLLRRGGFVVPMTGEHAVIYTLTNRGPVTCALSGYPKVVLYDAEGVALPFRYASGWGSLRDLAQAGDRGTGPRCLGLRPGGEVPLRPRCRAQPIVIRLTLPTRGAGVRGAEGLAIPGAAGLACCRGGPRGPGQVIAVSPVEPTQQATRSLR